MEISFGAWGRGECDSRHPQFCVDHKSQSVEQRQSEEASSFFTSVTQKKSEVNILNSSEMAMIRRAMVLCLSALIMTLLVTEVAATRYIGYPAMSRDGNYHCSRKSENCHPQPANPYNRGCEAAERCRQGLEAKVSDNKMTKVKISPEEIQKPNPKGLVTLPVRMV
ncbi:hypothetical protein RJ640_013659 [Escallonia rubra]|uniref:Rapid alkalinization factor n=1 Tax=Escallonia rubra TaxID=112253 RepID=A0AA88RBL3_9ASTE|nr:hypothetical protein RJ640_013659 [Escallonia rubra]